MRATAVQYPWTASGTSMAAALLPRWADGGGREALLGRFADPATRARIVTEMRDNMRRRGGAASLRIISLSRGVDSAALGKTLEEYAKLKGLDPIEAAIAVI